MTDWGIGQYELTASQSASVAPRVLDACEPVEERRLLDIACGTGNLAVVAAQRQATVTGLDGSARLLDVAAGRARSGGLSIEWVEGDFHELPFADDSFDVITSVFGIIFADKPQAAVAEVARVLEPAGRIAVTTWLDEGPMKAIQASFESRIAQSQGPPTGDDASPELDWGDQDQLRLLFAEHGLAVRCERQTLALEAESPEAQIEIWFSHHPPFLEMAELLGDSGYEAMRAECLAQLRAINEDPDAFRMTLPYLIVSGSPV